ncbi:hypothetical protein ACOT81_43325 [Streptomyces sp. WI04-05B]|uniref:hypothetical protein n=1 Tax=Streptomyces TaxID=1883 RepID=UPI0029A187EE|nr:MULTISPECIES: hypothetical protein [unclassified Streptomyces]MDX2543351.1 hypothetical protein [Streptomyces sp. WI04-05B]MDX2586753.1 hypothetical protein [Streptomyces sp. WI04-05A]
MTRKPTLLTMIGVLIGSGIAVGACSSGAGTSGGSGTSSGPAPAPSSPSAPSSTAPRDRAYHPVIDPAKFSNRVTNRYFPLPVGTTLVYEGTRDGRPQRDEVVITKETRVIMGVRCTVVRDTVTSNGALVEKTTDWYAQSAAGDVWYFGEATGEYTNGNLTSTKGSWEAGVDTAQPGVVMKAYPRPGDSYRQEYRPGEAEDMAKVLRTTATVKVPVGRFTNVVVTDDTDPLNPDKADHKSYAPGVGLVLADRVRSGHHEHIALVERRG